MTDSKFQRIRYARHRKFNGLVRGLTTENGQDGTDPGHPRLKVMDAWYEERAAAMAASGTLQTFTADPTGATATGILTLTGNALDGEIVTIGDFTYTFRTVLIDAPNNVFIGALATDSLDNLIAAINAGAGAGTLYGTGTTANIKATALAGAGDTMDLTAVGSGFDGNLVATTTDLTNGSFGDVTLTGGISANSLNIVAHGFNGVSGPFLVSNAGGALPAGLSAATLYWSRSEGSDWLQLFSSLDGAQHSDAEVDFTDAGTGTQSIIPEDDAAALNSKSLQGTASETIQGTDDIDDLT